MKKYLFGIFAIALAIGFSAFTVNHKTVVKVDATQTDLFWYEVDNGNVVGTPFNATAESRNTAVAAEYLGCTDDDDQPICLFGSNDDELATPIALPSEHPSVTIKKKD